MSFENFTPEGQDNSQTTPNSEKAKQSPEKTINNLLVGDLIDHAKRVGAGDKGVVLKIQHDQLSPDLQNALLKEQIKTKKDQAAKMIKVYSEGVVKDEFDIQKKASNVLNELSKSTECAKAPEPNFYSDIDLETHQREQLKQRTDHDDIEARAEFLLMDFVQGDTLYEHLLRKVLQIENNRDGNNEVSNLSADDLKGGLTDEMEDLAHKTLRFKKYNQDELAVDNLADQKAQNLHNENVDNLFTYLRQKEVRVKETVVKQLDNAIKALHEEGIAHRDMHWENIMIEGGPFEQSSGIEDGKEPQVYIIDFGESKITESDENIKDVFEGDSRRYMRDRTELNRLEAALRPTKNDSEIHETGVSSPFTRTDT